MQKAFRSILMVALVGIVIFGVFSMINGTGSMPKQMTYTKLMSELEKGKVEEMTIQPGQEVYLVKGKLKVQKQMKHLLLY